MEYEMVKDRIMVYAVFFLS